MTASRRRLMRLFCYFTCPLIVRSSRGFGKGIFAKVSKAKVS